MYKGNRIRKNNTRSIKENIKFYVLGPDLEARGLDNSNLTNSIEIVDYKGFVKLVADNEKTQNWL
jgi:tRNA 2-thiouridine synthesizing protein B